MKGNRTAAAQAAAVFDRIYPLDVLRIMATVFILLHHFEQLTQSWYDGMLNFYGGAFPFQRMGGFFFLLSGYLARPPKRGGEPDFPHYILPKLVRFLPMLAISVLGYEFLLWFRILRILHEYS